MSCNRLRTCAQRHHAFEVVGLVFVVGNRAPVAIKLIFAGPPSRRIPFGDHAMHAIGCEKAVFDALPQAVFVDRIAEVKVSVAIIVTQRRRGHAELIRRFEVFENRAPRTVIARAAAMALVHDYKVEEIRRECLEQSIAPFVLGQCLVGREIHFAAKRERIIADLATRIAEVREILVLRVIDEDVAVSEVEHARSAVFAGAIPVRYPQLPTDLECHRRLAGAGCHRE